jgi:hypothetical protein
MIKKAYLPLCIFSDLYEPRATTKNIRLQKSHSGGRQVLRDNTSSLECKAAATLKHSQETLLSAPKANYEGGCQRAKIGSDVKAPSSPTASKPAGRVQATETWAGRRVPELRV